MFKKKLLNGCKIDILATEMPRSECPDQLARFGQEIKKARKGFVPKVSQEDFAELCGVHRTYIGQIERGEKNISFENILRVASALRKRPSDIFRDAGL